MIGILSGGVMLAFGNNTDNAEAAAVLSELDMAKNALQGYSMRHRTRLSDGLADLEGRTPAAITASLDQYFDAGSRAKITSPGNSTHERFNRIQLQTISGDLRIGFESFPASSALQKAIGRKLANAPAGYIGSSSGSSYTVWLNVK
jgi:type II secretory pathway pseudopilin PulG